MATPAFTTAELRAWADEFSSGRELVVRVLPVEVDGDLADEALVTVELTSIRTDVYLRRLDCERADWSVTFGRRDRTQVLTPVRVALLSDELETVAQLGVFLEDRTLERVGTTA
jgi:hypothetical protein